MSSGGHGRGDDTSSPASDPATVLSPRALERRLKRHLRTTPQHFFAVAAPGFEPELLAEVTDLGDVREAETHPGGVAYTAPLVSVYEATLRLRTAHRILLRLREGFLAQTSTMLFDHARRVPWELHLGFAPAWSLRSSARASRLEAGEGVEATIGDAVRSRMEPLGLHPERVDEAPLPFLLRLVRDRATLSFDTSGHHLHRRGYRTDAGEAPLRETLAAAVARAAGVADADLVFDPFCGSGTLAIESALLLANAPVGAMGVEDEARSYAFEYAPWHRASQWTRVQREAIQAVRPIATRIVASDVDPSVLAAAAANAERAGVSEVVALAQADAFAASLAGVAEGAERPVLLANLPYGHRLGGPGAAADLSGALGAKLRVEGSGWRYGVVCADPDAFLTGLERDPERVVRFRNGGLAVALVVGSVG